MSGWRVPKEWRNLTADQLQSMPRQEILKILKRALKVCNSLPPGPEKNLLLKMGKCAIRLQNLVIEMDEKPNDESLKAEGKKIFEEVIKIMTKLQLLQTAEDIRKENMEVVEITEDFVETDDPWSSQYVKKIEPQPETKKTDDDNKVGEYDPWALNEEEL